MSGPPHRLQVGATLHVHEPSGESAQDDLRSDDGRASSLNDPITIAVYSPSNAELPSPRNDQYESHYTPIHVPSPPRSLQAASAHGTARNQSGGKSPSSRSPSSSSGIPPVPRTNRFTRELDATAIRSEENPPSSFPAHLMDSGADEDSSAPFTAVDPFAPKKHRLSWSSILKVRDGHGGRRRPVRGASDAWTNLASYEENFNDPDPVGYDVEDRNSSEEAVMDGEPLSAGGPHAEAHPTSLHHSASTASAQSEYKSFEDEKAKKPIVFPGPVPTYHRQPTNTTQLGAGPVNQPAPSLRFAKQVTVETLPVNTLGASDTTSDPQDISLFGLLLRYFPARMYLYFLLGVPRLYFTRVANIFEDANLQKEQLERLVLESASARRNPKLAPFAHNEAFTHLTVSWTHFIDTLLREWKTMNIISVLFLSAIVAILQIEAAFQDPIVHYAALFSLVSALMSLLFGCMYILRFNTMRMPHKAIQWAQETRKEQSNPFWNVWILLAIPAVWLVWSLLFYILCIMAFVWRVESGKTPPQFSDRLILAIRIGISTALATGIVYGAVVIRTFINFGAPMDKRYKKRLELFMRQQKSRMSQGHHRDRPPTLRDVDPWLQDQRTYRDRHSETSRRSGASRKSDYFFSAYATGVAHPDVHAPPPVEEPQVAPGATKQAKAPQTHVHFNPSRPSGSAETSAPAQETPSIPLVSNDPPKPNALYAWPEQIPPAQPSTMAPQQVAPGAEASSLLPSFFSIPQQPTTAATYVPAPWPAPQGPLSDSPPPLAQPQPAHTRVKTSSSASSDQGASSRNSPSLRGRPVRRLLQPRRAETMPAQQASQNLRSLEEGNAHLLPNGEDSTRAGPSRIHVSSTPALGAPPDALPSGGGLGVALNGSLKSRGRPPPAQRTKLGPVPLSFSSSSGPPYSHLVPHSPHRVIYNSVQYPSSLHLYHALPFLEHHADIVERIRICQDPSELRLISRNFATHLRPAELEAAAKKLAEVQTLKFRQHPELGKLLLGSGDRELIYCEADDWVLGVGSDGKGKNDLGAALMAVRSALKLDRSAGI